MMTASDLRLCRSLLFLPASNPRAIEKARDLNADMIILDLEDAVRPDDKEAARRGVVEALEHGFGGRPVAVRINAAGTPWFGDDVVALRHTPAPLVVIPKAESGRHVHDAERLLSRPILAMVETAAGVLAVRDIAAHAAALIAGVNDLTADLGIPPGSGRGGLSHSLQAIVLAARAARIAAFDGVYNKLEDEDGLAREAGEGRALGFDGKTLIHPSQIEIANRVFSPGQAEVDEALRLIAAASGGAERFEGRMIEAMHVGQAQAVIAKARR